MDFDLSNPNTQQLLGGIVRTLLVAGGGAGIFSGDQLGQAAGIIVSIIVLAWTIWQKKHSVPHSVLETAVTKASEGTPADAAAIIAAAKVGKF